MKKLILLSLLIPTVSFAFGYNFTITNNCNYDLTHGVMKGGHSYDPTTKTVSSAGGMVPLNIKAHTTGTGAFEAISIWFTIPVHWSYLQTRGWKMNPGSHSLSPKVKRLSINKFEVC